MLSESDSSNNSEEEFRSPQATPSKFTPASKQKKRLASPLEQIGKRITMTEDNTTQNVTNQDIRTIVSELLITNNTTNNIVLLGQFEAKLDEKLAIHASELKTVDLRVAKLEENLNKLKREKNLVIYGIPESNEEKNDSVVGIKTKLEELWKTLKLPPVDYDEAFRLGKSGNKRPILIKLLKLSDKKTILQNRKLLKGGQIYINLDLTKEEQTRERKLREMLKQYKQQDKNITGFIKRRQLMLYKDKKPFKTVMDQAPMDTTN